MTGSINRGGRVWAAAVAAAIVAAAGCGGGGGPALYPVAGRVLVDGQPLTGHTGTVTLVPEAAGGIGLSGLLADDGGYAVVGQRNAGVPPGRYKVCVVTRSAGLEPAGSVNSPAAAREAAKKAVKVEKKEPSPVPEKYAKPDTSGLVVEVVSAPAGGAYDLKLSR